MPPKEACEPITSKSDIRHHDNQNNIFVQASGMIRRSKQSVEENLKHLNDTNNEYWEKGDILGCKTNYPDNAETTPKYHVSPRDNQQGIKENGLIASPAGESCGQDGVYVTDTEGQARAWAHTLGAEEGNKTFDVYRVNVPKLLPIEKDDAPINKTAVPESEVVCTEKGFTKNQVQKIGEEIVDPSDESNMGGFR